MSASIARASSRCPCWSSRRARLVVARSSNILELIFCANAIASRKSAAAASGLLGCTRERFHLARAADELRKSASCGALQAGAQRPEPSHLVNIDWFGDAFDLGRTERLESEIALDQFARLLA